MTEYLSPVPFPADDAASPGVHRGIYGMPMFARIPVQNLDASAAFWTGALGFVELFAVPGRLIHLRRWAFQDVLLVPAGPRPEPPAPVTSALMLSFACVPSELPQLAEDCERILPGSADGPHARPWNSTELEVITPDGTHVVMTAARPLDPSAGMPAL
jgi:hypothetical protein